MSSNLTVSADGEIGIDSLGNIYLNDKSLSKIIEESMDFDAVEASGFALKRFFGSFHLNIEANESAIEVHNDLPSVTEIMEPLYTKAYGGISSRTMDIAADRGTRLHRSVQFYEEYQFENVDKDCAEYFKGYLKFRKEHPDWKLQASEERIYHKALFYAGTLDQRWENADGGIVLVDLKTTVQAHTNMWRVQLGAYAQAYESLYTKQKIAATGVLQLSNDSAYVYHDLKPDFSTFLACFQIHNFKE